MLTFRASKKVLSDPARILTHGNMILLYLSFPHAVCPLNIKNILKSTSGLTFNDTQSSLSSHELCFLMHIIITNTSSTFCTSHMMNVGYCLIPFSVCIMKLLPSISIVAVSVICFLAIYPSVYNTTYFLVSSQYENTKRILTSPEHRRLLFT